MSDKKVKVTKLPYMGPPKDDSKEEEHKRTSNTVPVTTGTKLAVPIPAFVRDRDYAKGGKTKAYAKGGDVQSESSKLDQKNAAMDKEQEEGFKRYQAEQAKEAKANADSRKTMPSFNFGKPEKKAKGGSVKSASARADGCCIRGKTRA
jgi:hypothetical protein